LPLDSLDDYQHPHFHPLGDRDFVNKVLKEYQGLAERKKEFVQTMP